MTRVRRMADCHPEKKHYAKGLCAKCYSRTLARGRKLNDRARWADPDKRARLNAQARARYQALPEEKRRARNAQIIRQRKGTQ